MLNNRLPQDVKTLLISNISNVIYMVWNVKENSCAVSNLTLRIFCRLVKYLVSQFKIITNRSRQRCYLQLSFLKTKIESLQF